jgi:hypothetical protein
MQPFIDAFNGSSTALAEAMAAVTTATGGYQIALQALINSITPVINPPVNPNGPVKDPAKGDGNSVVVGAQANSTAGAPGSQSITVTINGTATFEDLVNAMANAMKKNPLMLQQNY